MAIAIDFDGSVPLGGMISAVIVVPTDARDFFRAELKLFVRNLITMVYKRTFGPRAINRT